MRIARRVGRKLLYGRGVVASRVPVRTNGNGCATARERIARARGNCLCQREIEVEEGEQMCGAGTRRTARRTGRE